MCGCGEGTTWKRHTLGKGKTFESRFIKLLMSENTAGGNPTRVEVCLHRPGIAFVVTDICNQVKPNHTKNSHQGNLSAPATPWSQKPLADPSLSLSLLGSGA